MLNFILKKIVGSRNDRIIKSMRPLVHRINELEPKFKALSDEQLREQTSIFRQRLENGESLDSLLCEAFAAVREASIRTIGLRHFDVQLIGGIGLHRGMIAEMKTGEGKTLVATLAAYLNALTGKGVHVVTVNDYLARRDTEWMGRIYKFLGLSVGVVYSGMREKEKIAAYQSDITYGQNNEFGFDYLRDNMKYSPDSLMQRAHAFAIVDEVDSILIDEARTPLIISGPAEDSSQLYYTVNKIIPALQEGEHYEIELRTKQPTLTESGITKTEELLNVSNLYAPENIELIHHVNQALRAHKTMQRDVDYVVKDGKIIIVDDFTGRLMPGRRWSDGLHQAIEAKELLHIAEENQTLATITFQNFFRLYDKLSGMTGTAVTEAAEFKEIYKLDVLVIPTNKPMIRNDESDVVFRTRAEKYAAAAEDLIEVHAKGQPVLVGTISIEQSESMSKVLTQRGVPHNVLNAKYHEREAEIIAQAGRYGAVTIATNMAGRGTDIMLGGNPESLAQAECGTKDREDPAYQEALAKYRQLCEQEKSQVIESGGLFIMGTERHEARRIDNQLRGRAGRQGDPGISRFYVSLEDDLMRRFAGERMQAIMKRLGWEEGAALDGRMISRSIETAQKKVERFHFESRKHVTEYDDVMNKQRQVVYNLRNRVLHRHNLDDEISTMIDDVTEDLVLAACDEKIKQENWDFAKIKADFDFLFKADCTLDECADRQEIYDSLRHQAKEIYEERKNKHIRTLEHLKETYSKSGEVSYLVTDSGMREYDFEFSTFEQDTILERLDRFWNLHLQGMDNLRDTIGLRGYAQQNPLHEYQKEGFLMFRQMLEGLKQSILRRLFYCDAALENLVASFEAERQRRAALEQQMQLMHQPVLEPAHEGNARPTKFEPKNPEEQRAKLELQRKARRRETKRKKK
ncbi:MAG: preprotein translocase subunit SecA [Deltaproteobacteria bacterium]|nr:preprotein translocase subunit SecA [Deltaproteobacteria bacterium]